MRLRLNSAPFAQVGTSIGDDGQYRPVSFWQETTSLVPGEPLARDRRCDVAIIGGGFTALSVACELKRQRPDLSVVLLERSVIGHGASGRNGGFVMPLVGWDLSHAARQLGDARAQQAYRLMYAAVDHVKQLVARESIDCDLESTGYLLMASCPARERQLRHEAEVAARLGFEAQLLRGPELQAHLHSDLFRLGLFDPRPAIVNPAKLARGLKRLAERAGVEIYEQTPVVALDAGGEVAIRTPGGSVTARAAVLALNGYGAALGFMKRRIVPVHTFIVLTEPLTEAELASTGWHRHRASLESARNFIHYFRLTADNRILFGGEDATLYWNGSYRDQDPLVFARLEARFREFFPTLPHVKFTHRWGGVLGVTLDMFPTFGARKGNLFHAAGYSGHGVALSNYAGTILAPHLLHRLGAGPAPAESPFFFDRRPTWLPPDPFRYAGLQLYRLALRWGDRWQGS